MSKGGDVDRKWNQRPTATAEGTSKPEEQPQIGVVTSAESEASFRSYFERSPDAIWLFDPVRGVFVDCNNSAAQLMRCSNREELLQTSPADLSTPFQPDGKASLTKAAEITAEISRQGSMRFEWTARRRDGTDVALEVLATVVVSHGRPVHVVVSRDITERKRADAQVAKFRETLEQLIEERTAELRASEERFRTIVDHAPEAIVVFDASDGRFLICNENATALFGLPREQLTQFGPADLSPLVQPDGRFSSDAAKEYLKAAAAGETPAFEWIHKHSSGRLVTCEVRLVRLPGGGPPLIRGSIIDTTDRRRRERIQKATYDIADAVLTTEDLDALYARIHKMIRGLMPAHNFYIAVLDPVTEFISFPYYVDLLADSPPAPRRVHTGLTGHVLRTGKPLITTRHMAQRKRTVDEGVLVEDLELPYIESGRPAAVWLGVPLIIDGRTFGVIAVQDYEDDQAYGEEEKQVLTFIAAQTALAIHRKRSEQALRESEEKFRALFEASSQGVMLHDEKEFLEVNPATCRIVGYSAQEMIGKHPAQVAAPIQANGKPAAELAQRYISECLDRGSSRFEWIARNPQGKDIPLDVILTRVRMGGRWIIQAVIDDITERKRAENELLRALAREKELGQLKSNFVSMVSHEFRTPLGIIMSSADILQDYFEQLEPEERQRHLQSIHKNTRRMGELMEEVLLLGKLDSGRMACEPERLDLQTVLSRIVSDVSTATGGQSVIALDYKPVERSAGADERLMQHIFTNILSNAVKYSDPGSKVEFAVERHGSDAVFTVKDRGIGIPEVDQAWLFNAFHRGSNVGQRQGSGLGLVIVKRCVDLHGGIIRIHSAPGVGTTVMVALPLFRKTTGPGESKKGER